MAADQASGGTAVRGMRRGQVGQQGREDRAVPFERPLSRQSMPTYVRRLMGRFYPFGSDRLTTSGRFIRETRVALTHRDASSMTARCDPLR
jgi:hypothetical protein